MAKIPVRDARPDEPSLEERMGEMWRRMMGGPVLPVSREGLWHPAVDIYDCDDRIVVQLDLPGMEGRDVSVSLREQHLLVEGSRPPSEVAEGAEPYYRERAVGDFHRIIHLPVDVDADATGARYEDGVLTVTMPKKKREGVRKIVIT